MSCCISHCITVTKIAAGSTYQCLLAVVDDLPPCSKPGRHGTKLHIADAPQQIDAKGALWSCKHTNPSSLEARRHHCHRGGWRLRFCEFFDRSLLHPTSAGNEVETCSSAGSLTLRASSYPRLGGTRIRLRPPGCIPTIASSSPGTMSPVPCRSPIVSPRRSHHIIMAAHSQYILGGACICFYHDNISDCD